MKKVLVMAVMAMMANVALACEKPTVQGYEYVGCMFDGLAVAKKDGKYGFLDKAGKKKIDFIYDGAEGFQEGLSKVKKGKMWGFVDKTGKEIVPPKYDFVWAFQDGLGLVKQNDKYGFVDKAGELVIPIQYEDAHSFNGGFAVVKKGGEVNFINKAGKVPFDNVFALIDGKAGLFIVKQNNKYGLLNTKGQFILPLEYDDIENFDRNNLFKVKQNGRYGIVDKTGKVVMPVQYLEMDDFSTIYRDQKLAYIKDENGKYGFFNRKAEIIVLPQYDDIKKHSSLYLEYGMAVVSKNGKWGVINMDNKEIVPILYNKIGGTADLMVYVENDVFKGFYNVSDNNVGRIAIDFSKLTYINWCNDFDNLLLCVQGKNGKWGYINREGELVIPLEYDKVSSAWKRMTINKGRLAEVYKNGEKFYIDKIGKRIN